ncbi:hypothetical protein V8E55_000652 [Tylopilus felleus]
MVRSSGGGHALVPAQCTQMSENQSQPILNPNIYLNYLQPGIATQYEVTRDIFLATLGALLWDILSSLPDDWKLIRTTKPSTVLFAYFASRTCALAVVLISVLAKTGPVQNCGVMQLILALFWVFASGSSSYLFLKRVHAVFPQERLVRHTFTALWIVSVGASTVILPGSLHDYYQIADTKHCINVSTKSYVAAAFIVLSSFDALVHSAISYKILKFHRTKKLTGWKAVFCKADALPHFSRAIFQGGQQYYAITNGFNITRYTVALSQNISPILQLAPLVPAVALTSAMACRVFRKLKLEALQKTEVANMTTIRFADRAPANVGLQKDTDFTSTEDRLDQC